MRLDELPRSDNVEDRRGDGSGGFPMGRTGGIGIGTIILLGLIGWALGINPIYLIGGAEILSGLGGSQQQSQPAPGNAKTEAPSDQWVSSYRPCSEARKSSGRRSLRKLAKLTRRRRSSCSPAQRAQHAGLPSPSWGRSTVRTTRKSISTPHSFRSSSGVSVAAMSEARAANSPRPM